MGRELRSGAGLRVPAWTAPARGGYREDMDGGDGLDDLARELRDRVGHELRQEAELIEQDAATVERRRRTLSDLAIELLSRGDSVTVVAGERSIRGRVTYARGEILALQTSSGRFDVHLASGVVLRVDERTTEGGSPPTAGSDTLRARLLELELAGSSIEVWAPAHGVSESGAITAVGRDHLIIADRDGREWAVPLLDIAWVRTA